MLEEKMRQGYGDGQDYNCAEKILNGSNETYGLGLEGKCLKMAAAFGGGMGTGKTCGAVAASLMVLGMENTETVAHKSPEVKAMAAQFQKDFTERMGSIECDYLKEDHWEPKCAKVIREAAALLDTYMKEKRYDCRICKDG